MKEKEKLIITLWRAQLQNPLSTQSVYCRLTYNNQEHNSKEITSSKSLAWKETFVFPLANKNKKLRLDFINTQEDQEIHFVKEQVLESLSLGKSILLVNLDNSNRGTVPAKLPIVDID